MMPSFRFLLLVTAMLPATIGHTQNQAGHTDFTVGDRLAIKNVIASHFLYLDGFRIDKWMTNFTDDATFVVELGTKRFAFDHPGFEKFFRERFAKFQQNGQQRRHIISNIVFAKETKCFASIRANGLLLSTTRGGPTELVNGLTFEGSFTKTKGVWKISMWTVRGDTIVTLDSEKGATVSEVSEP